MEPSQQNSDNIYKKNTKETPAEATLSEPWHAPLNRVTTFSKYFALALFIILPFVGFWLGVEYGAGQIRALPASVTYKECDLMGGIANSITQECFVDGHTVPAYSSGANPFVVESSVMQQGGTQVPAGEEIKRLQICDELQYPSSVDLCYMQYAQSRKDASLCEYVQDEDMREQCVESSAPEQEPVLEVYILSANPSAISVNEKETLRFDIGYRGTTSLPSVRLVEVDESGEEIRTMGELYHDGEGLNSGQYGYTGTYVVGPYSEERTVQFQAHLMWNDGFATTSELCSIVVTKFPLSSAPLDGTRVVRDPISGEDIMGDEVLIGVKDGTSPDRVREIAAAIDGEVVGGIYDWGSYQVQIPFTADGSGVYEAIEVLEVYEEVEYAEPNGIVSFDS